MDMLNKNQIMLCSV